MAISGFLDQIISRYIRTIEEYGFTPISGPEWRWKGERIKQVSEALGNPVIAIETSPDDIQKLTKLGVVCSVHERSVHESNQIKGVFARVINGSTTISVDSLIDLYHLKAGVI
jgi:hypothetical protein